MHHCAQVNKAAQRTDAGQLSRNLLLETKATVNVKPNLQIIADDVKCTHGCAVSDLSEDEMFYFRARGIDATVARQALVYSFGSEIVQKFEHKELVDRIKSIISSKLGTKI
jgi:Fe-S cluster assembly protein SufD